MGCKDCCAGGATYLTKSGIYSHVCFGSSLECTGPSTGAGNFEDNLELVNLLAPDIFNKAKKKVDDCGLAGSKTTGCVPTAVNPRPPNLSCGWDLIREQIAQDGPVLATWYECCPPTGKTLRKTPAGTHDGVIYVARPGFPMWYDPISNPRVWACCTGETDRGFCGDHPGWVSMAAPWSFLRGHVGKSAQSIMGFPIAPDPNGPCINATCSSINTLFFFAKKFGDKGSWANRLNVHEIELDMAMRYRFDPAVDRVFQGTYVKDVTVDTATAQIAPPAGDFSGTWRSCVTGSIPQGEVSLVYGRSGDDVLQAVLDGKYLIETTVNPPDGVTPTTVTLRQAAQYEGKVDPAAGVDEPWVFVAGVIDAPAAKAVVQSPVPSLPDPRRYTWAGQRITEARCGAVRAFRFYDNSSPRRQIMPKVGAQFP